MAKKKDKDIERLDVVTKLKKKEKQLEGIAQELLDVQREKTILEKQLAEIPIVVPGWYVFNESDTEEFGSGRNNELPSIVYIKKVCKKKHSLIKVDGILIGDNYFESSVKSPLLLDDGERVDRTSLFSIREDTDIIQTEGYNLLAITDLEILVKYGFNPEDAKGLVNKKEQVFFVAHAGKAKKVVGYIRDDIDSLFRLW